MSSPRLAFVMVAVASVAAAGGGSYLATRPNAGQATVVPAVATPEPIAPPSAAPPPRAGASTVPSSSPLVSVSTGAPAKREGRRIPPDTEAPPNATTARREEPPPAEEPSAAVPSAAPAAAEDVPAPTIETRPIETTRTVEPPTRTFEELVVASDAVIGLQTEGLISSERARIEDRVEARVSRDVRVGGTVAIPAGSRALGTVVVVERGGRLRERARLGIRFHTLQLADGTRVPISTETIYRYGDAPGNGSAAKIGGGAVAGAILGAIIGGGKGAAIGAATGASAGTATVMTGERNTAVFPPGADVTARILSPITVSIERE